MERAIPYLSLVEATNEYMLASFNDRRKYFINYLSHAKWIWKELMWNTLWAVKSKYVKVDTSTSPHSIVIPKDMVRFINLSKEDDCKAVRSLSFNDNMSVLKKPTGENLCEACGQDDYLGQCVSNITVVQKDVVIEGNTYVEKIWKKVCSNGDLVEIRQTPTKSYTGEGDEFEIAWETIQTYICKLEKKPCGCIKDTEQNKTLIITHCGCFLSSCQHKMCDSTLSKPYRKFGTIKVQDGRIYIENNTDDWLILSYQTNGECEESELMIPEYALEALLFGIDYRAKALRPGTDRFEKRESAREYNKKISKLEEFLNPIIMTEFMNAQGNFPKWGSNSDACDPWVMMMG